MPIVRCEVFSGKYTVWSVKCEVYTGHRGDSVAVLREGMLVNTTGQCLSCLAVPWALPCTQLHCTALHCTALHCTALHCTALNCTALHCSTECYHMTREHTPSAIRRSKWCCQHRALQANCLSSNISRSGEGGGRERSPTVRTRLTCSVYIKVHFAM